MIYHQPRKQYTSKGKPASVLQNQKRCQHCRILHYPARNFQRWVSNLRQNNFDGTYQLFWSCTLTYQHTATPSWRICCSKVSPGRLLIGCGTRVLWKGVSVETNETPLPPVSPTTIPHFKLAGVYKECTYTASQEQYIYEVKLSSGPLHDNSVLHSP